MHRHRFAALPGVLAIASLVAAPRSAALDPRLATGARIQTQAAPAAGLARQLVREYYATVDFNVNAHDPFDPDAWAAWLADDYVYVESNGVVVQGKAAAVEEVTAGFLFFSSVQSYPNVVSAKLYDETTLATVVDMHITAVTLDGQTLSVHTTVSLNFHQVGGRWLAADETVVFYSA